MQENDEHLLDPGANLEVIHILLLYIPKPERKRQRNHLPSTDVLPKVILDYLEAPESSEAYQRHRDHLYVLRIPYCPLLYYTTLYHHHRVPIT